MTRPDLPARIEDVDQLEDVLTTPDAALIEDLARLEGDIMVLGVGGKMGPTLACLAKRAAPAKRVIGVARFSEEGLENRLRQAGVETIRCDLLDRAALDALPGVRVHAIGGADHFFTGCFEDLAGAIRAALEP
jgi:hypothetical protein